VHAKELAAEEWVSQTETGVDGNRHGRETSALKLHFPLAVASFRCSMCIDKQLHSNWKLIVLFPLAQSILASI
jgi:hypothetical protein